MMPCCMFDDVPVPQLAA